MSESRRVRQSKSEQADAIAREAARLLSTGKAVDLHDATRKAEESRGSDLSRHPSAKRIRQHAQALDMQTMGEEAYRQQIRVWLEHAEDLMTTIEQAVPDSETLLVGRAAEAHFDGDPAIHIRVHCEPDIGVIARAIAVFGYDETEATFPTMESRYGRLSQMHWIGEGGVKVTLTRCPQRSVFDDRCDLVTGKPIAWMNVDALRLRLRA